MRGKPKVTLSVRVPESRLPLWRKVAWIDEQDISPWIVRIVDAYIASHPRKDEDCPDMPELVKRKAEVQPSPPQPKPVQVQQEPEPEREPPINYDEPPSHPNGTVFRLRPDGYFAPRQCKTCKAIYIPYEDEYYWCSPKCADADPDYVAPTPYDQTKRY